MRKYFIRANCSFVGQTGYNAHSRDFFTELSKKVNLKVRNFTVGKSWNGLVEQIPLNGRYEDPHKNEYYMTEYQRNLISEQTLYVDPNHPYHYNGLGDFEINEGTDYRKKYKNDDIIDIILSETNHQYFYSLDKYKGFKIAYNVWESTLYDPNFFELLKMYDQFWCPSEWQKQCIIKQGYPAEKVFVVPEAVDGNVFKPANFDYNLDMYRDNRFKFVMFGRWEYRKSTAEIIDTFLRTFNQNEPVDLILAVDNSDYANDGMKTTEERLNHYGFNDNRLKVLHFVKREDYINYLRNGHVFLSCARSEGWNLPLIEAMACGTPSIYSDCSGQLEFTKGKGHPVKILGEKQIPGGYGNFYEPDFDDLSKVMRNVYINYWKYKNDAIKESELIRSEFSWENAANKALNILDEVYKIKNQA